MLECGEHVRRAETALISRYFFHLKATVRRAVYKPLKERINDVHNVADCDARDDVRFDTYHQVKFKPLVSILFRAVLQLK